MAGLAVGVALVVVPVAAWAMTAPFAGELPEVLRQVRLYGSQTPWRQVLAPKVALLLVLPLIPLAAQSVAWAIDRRRGTGRAAAPESPTAAVVAFAVAWLALEIVGVVLQKRAYAYHFLPTVPPAARLCGLVPVRPRPWVVGAALAPAVALSLAASWPMLRRVGEPARMASVNAYLEQHARPGEAVWADPGPRVFIPTGLRPGMRYAFTHYFVNYDDAPLDFAARMVEDLDARRPEWAVVLNPAGQRQKVAKLETQPGVALSPRRRENLRRGFAEVLGYLDAHYRTVAEVDGFTIARRSDGPAGAGMSTLRDRSPLRQGYFSDPVPRHEDAPVSAQGH